MVAVGTCLALAGAVQLGRQGRMHPAPPPSATLRTGGAYGLTRHPIYMGLVSAAAGVALVRARPEPLAASVALAAVLTGKARYEERLLHDRFGAAYAAYRERVPGGLPALPASSP